MCFKNRVILVEYAILQKNGEYSQKKGEEMELRIKN